MKKKILFFGIPLVAGLALGLAVAAQNTAAPVTQNRSLSSGMPLEDSVINVAGTTGRAVVSISTEHKERMRGGRSFYFNAPFNGSSPFGDEDFFRRFFENFPGEMPEKEYRQIGLGSGVIIDAQGYILTNAHVVEGADKITVTLPDGRKFKGEIKGQDARSDLAVVKINANNLPVAALGDSTHLKIGQWAVAIGNPFGFAMENPEPTVTVGVISALHRTLGRVASQDKDYNDLIQTDAAINPGNSGGPLVNLGGEVVGVNVAIFTTTGGYQGVGFAIPINNAKRILSRLIEGKKILYGWLGVTVQNLNEDLAKYFGLSEKSGVLVAKVSKDSPAEKVGIKEGDLIKKYDGAAVASVKELVSSVGKTEVGRKVKIVLLRDKKEMNLEVTIGERPQEPGEESFNSEGTEAPTPASLWRGLSVDELNTQNAARFRTEEKEGVIVTDVAADSPAEESGIMPGDMIKAINKQPVKNLSDYQKITKGLKGDCLIDTSRGYSIIKEK